MTPDELVAALRALDPVKRRECVAAALDGGAPRYDTEAARELAERDRIEQALLASESELARAISMFTLVLDSIPVRVFWKDAQLRYLGCNRLFAHDAGLAAPETIVGLTDHDLSWREDAERYRADDQRVLATLEPRLAYDELQTRANGRQIRLRTSKLPLLTPDGEIVGVLGVYEDVTEQRALQARLHEAQHLEAIGQLAGGVAHDFNNLLTGVLGNAELIRDVAPSGSEIHECASEILAASRRAADLTGQLLAFSRRGRLQNVVVDMHSMIQQTMTVLRHDADRALDVTARLEATSPRVQGDPNQLANALLDLAMNARDAVRPGGKISFVTRNRTVEPDDAHELAPGRYLEVAVIDDGIGIADDHLPRVFEPFFTTKRTGQGTGLGLAAVFGCAKGHGGSVRVESTVGSGSTFTLTLPTVAHEMRATPRGVALPGTAHGRVLVIDDEEVVRTYAARALRREGYEVEAVADGQAAIELVRTRPGEFDLALLDLVMPKVTGEETFHALRRLEPNLPIVIASGFSRQHAADVLMAAGARGFLAKPFRRHELLLEVGMHLRRPAR